MHINSNTTINHSLLTFEENNFSAKIAMFYGFSSPKYAHRQRDPPSLDLTSGSRVYIYDTMLDIVYAAAVRVAPGRALEG